VVSDLIEGLNRAAMLENQHAAGRKAAVLNAYRAAAFREPALVGSGYPAEPQALEKMLRDYVDAAHDVDPREVDWTRGVGVLSPHIDYARGGTVYGRTWRRAASAAQQAEVVILLGTDHYGDDPFTLTRQNYATPLGVLPTEQNAVSAVVHVLGEDAAFRGELRHKGEHSLELVAVWLQHMRGGKPVTLVPILCGSLRLDSRQGDAPRRAAVVAQVVEALRESTAGRRVLFVASGDLAHVGPAFGGEALDAQALEVLRDADERLLLRMEEGDAGGFLREIGRVKDRNNVCGVAPVYATLRALEIVQGEVTAYAVCPADAQGTSVVTVAGVVFN
jgi:hypothetical protein